MPHNADLAAWQTRRITVVLAVQLPCRAPLVATRVDLMAVGEPEMQAAVLVPVRVGDRLAGKSNNGRSSFFIAFGSTTTTSSSPLAIFGSRR